MVVGAKVLGCSLVGDSLIGRTWMEVCRVGRDVVCGFVWNGGGCVLYV